MTTRISGLMSGLDIDTLVKDMMKSKRAPLDKLTQQKQTLEWQREQYRDINAKIVDFRQNKLFNYGLSSAISAKQVSVTGNTSAVSAKANSDAVVGNISIEVTDLATGDSVMSQATGFGAVDMNATLKTLKTSKGFAYTADADGKITVNVGASGSIKLDENTDTLATFISKLNSSKDANVNAYLDGSTGKISITSKGTGDASTIAVDLGATIFSNFNLGAVDQGHDADVTINGIATKRSSNTFTENGVQITLNAKTLGTAATLKTTSNTDKIVDTIKSFVKDYNDLLDTVNKKLGEERYRSFTPLTSDQKKEMSDDEVKLWEDKAKSGLLRNDSTFGVMVSSFRLAAITDVNVNGQDVNLTAFGITTGDYTQKGKLVVDEEKLRKALDSNPDQVIGFFSQKVTETSSVPSKAAVNPNNGLFARLSNISMFALSELATKAGTSRVSSATDVAFSADSRIGEQLRSLDNRMSDMTRRLTMAEDRYYKQFAAMESAMSKYSSQSSMFGG